MNIPLDLRNLSLTDRVMNYTASSVQPWRTTISLDLVYANLNTSLHSYLIQWNLNTIKPAAPVMTTIVVASARKLYL